MRIIAALIMTLALTGCEFIGMPSGNESKAVDAATLPPLTSREQSLIYAADGSFQQGNYAAAERDYMTAVADSKGRIDAHLALARLYEKQQLPQNEKTILTRALVLQPNHPFANYLLGKIYLDANEYSNALSAFQHGRITKPDDSDLTVGEAVSQDMLGNHSAAQRLYVTLLHNNPQSNLEVVRTNLAMSYLLSNNPKQAAELLKNEAAKPNASAVTRHNLALAYGLLGRHSDAKATLKGDIDEETRLLAIARMQAYYRERSVNAVAPPLTPSITEIAAPVEPVSTKPIPVIMHDPVAKAPAAKPRSVAAPVKPMVTKASVVVKESAPANVPVTNRPPLQEPEFDPNMMPGMVIDPETDAQE